MPDVELCASFVETNYFVVGPLQQAYASSSKGNSNLQITSKSIRHSNSVERSVDSGLACGLKATETLNGQSWAGTCGGSNMM